MDRPSRVIVRDATFDDAEEASRVLREVGLRLPAAGAESRDHWARLWLRNPAVIGAKAPLSLGWALEDDCSMVGFFGNVPLRYDWGDEQILVGNASQWGVQPAYRGETDRLCQRYFTQPNVGLLLVTTGIRATGRIFERYNGTRLPQPNYDEIHYWIVDATGFAEAALRKKNVSAGPARWFGRLVAPAVAIGNIARARRLVSRIAVQIVTPSAIDESFDDLWRRKRAERPRLLACRDGQWLRWHFADRPSTADTFIITARDTALSGYVVVMRDDAPAIGLKRLKVVDILVAGDNPQTVRALMDAVVDLARGQLCHVVEFFGIPPELRAAVATSGPRQRRMPTWPAFYRALYPAIAKDLAHEANWYVTSYDGDTTLV